jgi:hypothetical protein
VQRRLSDLDRRFECQTLNCTSYFRCPNSHQASHQISASCRVSVVEASIRPGPLALGIRAEVFQPEPAAAAGAAALAAGSAVPVLFRSAVAGSVAARSGGRLLRAAEKRWASVPRLGAAHPAAARWTAALLAAGRPGSAVNYSASRCCRAEVRRADCLPQPAEQHSAAGPRSASALGLAAAHPAAVRWTAVLLAAGRPGSALNYSASR